MQKRKKLETTLGDLIVALTDEATRLVSDEREAYKLVAFALTNHYDKPGVRADKLALIH